MNWLDTGRFLIIAGVVIVAIGILFTFADKIPLGKLPGDISFGNQRFKVYIPIATCIFVSVMLTIIVNFFARK